MARKSLRSLSSVLIVALVILSLLGISTSGQTGGAKHPPIAGKTAAPTATPTPSPTPSPTRPPPPPFIPMPQVYLTAHGNQQLPEIALTFDDGPSPGYTNTILAILERYHIHATFFELGVWVQRYPDLARAVFADGDVIGDHTWGHPDLTKLGNDQINQQLANTRDIIQQATGVRTALFRPPYGAYTRRVLDLAAALQFSTIVWSVDPRDWSRPGTDAIISRVVNATQNGSIILLHDGGGDRSQTVAALPTIIEQLQQRGFTFVTIPQLLIHLPPPTGAMLARQSASSAAQASEALSSRLSDECLTERKLP